MAVTKIWDVKGWLGKAVIYIEYPAKTVNSAFYEKESMTEMQAQGLTKYSITCRRSTVSH